jgi:hypothetical protein
MLKWFKFIGKIITLIWPVIKGTISIWKSDSSVIAKVLATLTIIIPFITGILDIKEETITKLVRRGPDR